ncbi:MAG: bifunctional pyr operon transcriptional regulator/uracil phosphoribosyltransferase PyrR [Burkholderiales bacterium]|nr:bifunctional pyr operon transcriptional regulator/uracil phosphoribosyltransferase PyrR [Phycisphaerae bacterium]
MQAKYDQHDFAKLLGAMLDKIVALVAPGEPINLVGIRTRGETLALRLRPLLNARGIHDIGFGALDITLYRDDLSEIGPRPLVRPTVFNFDMDRKPLILVDDVLFTGRTVRAALDALADFGRPSAVKLAVLVDRGGRELPIQADVVGLALTTVTREQVVKVKISGKDAYDGIEIEKRITA